MGYNLDLIREIFYANPSSFGFTEKTSDACQFAISRISSNGEILVGELHRIISENKTFLAKILKIDPEAKDFTQLALEKLRIPKFSSYSMNVTPDPSQRPQSCPSSGENIPAPPPQRSYSAPIGPTRRTSGYIGVFFYEE